MLDSSEYALTYYLTEPEEGDTPRASLVLDFAEQRLDALLFRRGFWGFLFGSYFGVSAADIGIWHWFNPITDPMNMLFLSLGLGLFQIRKHDTEEYEEEKGYKRVGIYLSVRGRAIHIGDYEYAVPIAGAGTFPDAVRIYSQYGRHD